MSIDEDRIISLKYEIAKLKEKLAKHDSQV